MVILKHTTESLTALDLARDGTDLFVWLDDLVVQSLMIAFGVIVLNEIGHGSFQRSLAKEDHAVKTLGLQTAKPTFHVRVQIRALGRQ